MSYVYLGFDMSHNSKFYLAVYTPKNFPKSHIFFPNSSQGPFPKMAGKALCAQSTGLLLSQKSLVT